MNTEEIVEIVPRYLRMLHNRSFYKADIKDQCRQRFGMSWNEVRDVVYRKVERGYDLLPGVNIHPEFLVRGIAPYGGNWMINRFLCVIYLSYIPSRASVEYAKKYLKNFSPSEDDLCTLMQGGFAGELTWVIMTLAREICPEIVEQVLSSHGLTSKQGYRMQGVEIVVSDDGKIATRKVKIG